MLIDNGGGSESYAFQSANARLEGSGFNVEPAPAPAPESVWRSMDSAPRDRTTVLVWDLSRRRSYTAFWRGAPINQWSTAAGGYTDSELGGWMPKPEGPATDRSTFCHGHGQYGDCTVCAEIRK